MKEHATARIARLIKTAKENSPIAAALLDAAHENCSFIADANTTAVGYYAPLSGVIALNPNFSDACLLSTLVHEARHAQQPQDFREWAHDTRSNIQWVRAAEADANAFQCAAAYEMKGALPEVWQAYKNKHAGIATAYETEMHRSGDVDKALNGAFQAFHDDMRYVSVYDDRTVKRLTEVSKGAGTGFLKRSLPPETIGEKMCENGGKSYLDKGFMSSERALRIGDDLWPGLINLKYKAFELADRYDMSVHEFYNKDGRKRESFVSNEPLKTVATPVKTESGNRTPAPVRPEPEKRTPRPVANPVVRTDGAADTKNRLQAMKARLNGGR